MLIRLLEEQYRFRDLKETLINGTTSHPPTGSEIATPDTSVDVETVLLTSIVCLILVVSLVANVLVLVVIGRTRRLHRMNNALIVSLVIADTLRSAVVMPTFILLSLTDLATAQPWLCQFYDLTSSFCDVTVVLNAVFIGVERAFVISKPLEYQRVVTRTKMAVFISTLWIFCALYGGLQSFRYFIFKLDAEGTTVESPVSGEDCRAVQPSTAFAAFDFSFTFCASFLVIALAYGKIVFVVRSQMKRIQPTQQSDAYVNSEYTTPYTDHRISTRDTSISRRDSFGQQPDSYHERSYIGAGHPARIVTVNSQEKNIPENIPGSNHREILQRIQEDVDFDTSQRDEQSNRKISTISSPALGGQPRLGQARRVSLVTHNRIDIHRSISGSQLSRIISNTPTIVTTDTCDDDPLNELPITLPLSRSIQPTIQSVGAPPKRRRSSVTFNLYQSENAPEHFLNDLRTQSVPTELAQSAKNELIHCAPKDSNQIVEESVQCIEDVDDISKPDSGYSKPPRPQASSIVSSDGTSSTYLSSSAGNNHRRISQASFTTTRSSVAMTSRRDSIVTQLNRNKAFKMTSIVVGTFVAGWFPVSICQLLLVVSPSLISRLTWDIVQIIAFLVSAVNPFVYSFYSAEFRWSVKRLMTCDTDKPDMPWA